MGVNYSKMMCADTQNKCAYTQPIPYPIYSKNVRGKTPLQIHEYVCGTHQKEGVDVQCCDPFDPAANEIVKDGGLIKVLRDNSGNYTEFHICKCSNKECEVKNCKDFKYPTQYEKCRARAIDPSNEIKVSAYVSKVVASNAYTNCYQLC
jgi:hypothetical protein